MLRDLLGYDSNWKNEGYEEGPFIPIVRLTALVPIVIRCLLKNEKRGRHCSKQYANTDGRRLETVKK